ncbi:MAG: NAD-dependent epimerase/dehydratase family protein [Chloroflexota bacterium]
MTMFITGGTSSIGRVLVKSLAQAGETARLLVRQSSDLSGLELPGIEFVYGDVCDPQPVREGMQGCARVTHLAAIVGHNVPEATWWQVNREGTRHVLQAALEQGVSSFVQVSSISVLGPTQPGEIADEKRPVDTAAYVNLYQKTKRAADEIAGEYAGRGLNVKIVYPCFGYGCSRASSHPSMQEQTLLRMAAGKPAAILGSGKNVLCLSYYRDTVEGIRLAHEGGRRGENYILGGDNLTFVEIWAAVAKVLGKRPPRRRVPLALLRVVSEASRRVRGRSVFPPDFFEMIGMNWRFSSAKAQAELGWRAHGFEDGIRETWEEYQR